MCHTCDATLLSSLFRVMFENSRRVHPMINVAHFYLRSRTMPIITGCGRKAFLMRQAGLRRLVGGNDGVLSCVRNVVRTGPMLQRE